MKNDSWIIVFWIANFHSLFGLEGMILRLPSSFFFYSLSLLILINSFLIITCVDLYCRKSSSVLIICKLKSLTSSTFTKQNTYAHLVCVYLGVWAGVCCGKYSQYIWLPLFKVRVINQILLVKFADFDYLLHPGISWSLIVDSSHEIINQFLPKTLLDRALSPRIIWPIVFTSWMEVSLTKLSAKFIIYI